LFASTFSAEPGFSTLTETSVLSTPPGLTETDASLGFLGTAVASKTSKGLVEMVLSDDFCGLAPNV